MRFRRPSIAISLSFLVVMAALLTLGFWQVQRAGWKAELLAERQARLALPPIALAHALADPDSAVHRAIAVTGRFLHDAEMHAGAPKHRRIVGRDLVAPLMLEDTAATGRPVLVVRGWVPLDDSLEPRRPAGRVTVSGWVARSPAKNAIARALLPADRPDDRYWVRVDIDAMARTVGLRDPLPFHIVAAPDSGSGVPIGRRPELAERNAHVSYAVTWFGLAAVLVVMFTLFHRRRASPEASE